MIPPLIRVALREPGLLAEHAQGYSQLARHEYLAWRGRLRRRLLWWALSVLFAMAALILTGTALIAWSVTGVTHGLLWGVPLLPWVAAALAALRAVRLDASDEHEGRLWDQIDADIQLLKELP
jgi:hypothetical protein